MSPDAETIPTLLAHRVEVDADLDAIVAAGDGRVTYAGVDIESQTLAQRLVAAGVVKGDRVGLMAPNGIDWALSAFAVMRIGAVLVPFSTLLRPPELLAQVATASVSHLLVVRAFRGRRYLDELDAEVPGLVATVRAGGRHRSAPSLRRIWTVHGPGQAPPADGIPEARASAELVQAMGERVRPADDMVVLFTSGSTGSPKGTIHTHGGALRATAAGLDARRVLQGERLYIPMPFFWTGGFCGGLLSAALAGATLITEAEPEPTRTLDLLQQEGVTLFRGWPDQAARLAAHPAFAEADLSTLGDGSLGALLPPERRPAPGSRPNLFGMTESFGPYCGARLDVDLPEAARGSCGRPFEGTEVRIVDPDSGEPVAIGEEGRIQLRGPNLLRGVCGRDRSEVFTVDGWFGTGDRGRLDDAGYLWYRGRLDDMFKVKGATVYPSEVEGALRALDSVRQAHVTDVAAEGSAEVGALVVTDDPVEAVEKALRDRLSAFKVPTRWIVTTDASSIPMTATGKVDKTALRERLGRSS